MNIHFEQVERKSQVVSYLLAAFAVFTVVMLTLSFVREAELQWSFSSTSGQAVQMENSNLPVPIPAPLPPAGQELSLATDEPAGESEAILVPEVIAVPMPAMP